MQILIHEHVYYNCTTKATLVDIKLDKVSISLLYLEHSEADMAAKKPDKIEIPNKSAAKSSSSNNSIQKGDQSIKTESSNSNNLSSTTETSSDSPYTLGSQDSPSGVQVGSDETPTLSSDDDDSLNLSESNEATSTEGSGTSRIESGSGSQVEDDLELSKSSDGQAELQSPVSHSDAVVEPEVSLDPIPPSTPQASANTLIDAAPPPVTPPSSQQVEEVAADPSSVDDSAEVSIADEASAADSDAAFVFGV